MFTSQNMTVFGVVKDDQSCKETVKFSLVYCKPFFFFQIQGNFRMLYFQNAYSGNSYPEWWSRVKGQTNRIILQCRVTKPGGGLCMTRESRMLPSSWAVERALDREFMVMSTTWSQTLKSDILGWNPDSWLQVMGIALETRVFLLGPEWRLK